MSLLILPRSAFNHRAPTDPYFSFVTSLLHFNGSPGSTTIVDQIGANTWTAHGGAQLSNTQSKFGGTSLKCTSSGDFITALGSSNFAFGTTTSVPFTIEGWIFRTSSGSDQCLIDFRNLSTGGIALYTELSSIGGASGIFDNAALVFAGVSISTGLWHHWAIGFDTGPMLYLYIDGVMAGSAAYNPAWQAAPIPFIADNVIAPSQPSLGYYDDIRMTKGVNRYPGGTTFTPPTAQFPDS